MINAKECLHALDYCKANSYTASILFFSFLETKSGQHNVTVCEQSLYFFFLEGVLGEGHAGIQSVWIGCLQLTLPCCITATSLNVSFHSRMAFLNRMQEEKKNKYISLLNPTPQGDSSFVVMTNYIITEGQKMGKCPEVGENTPVSLCFSRWLTHITLIEKPNSSCFSFQVCFYN